MSAVTTRMDHISFTLKKYFQGKNLSAIARELGISKSLLADWVNARRVPSLKNIHLLAKVANHIGLNLEELLLGKKPERTIVSSIQFKDAERLYRILIERIK